MPDAVIEKVHCFSTGSAEQHREHRFGSRLPKTVWALLSRSWVGAPINVFVVEHRDSLILFDAGLDPAISDTDYISSALGRFFLRRVFRFSIGANDALAQNLERLGLASGDVSKVVFSHLHFDHIGGVGEVPKAQLLVSTREWQQLSMPHPERDWILREHIELPGARWVQVDFSATDDPALSPFGVAHDLLGDRSLVLLPTPGHTPGSMSMLVRTPGRPPLLLVGDLTYEPAMLTEDCLPGVYSSAAELRDSFARVRALQEVMPDLVVLASHDPSAEEALNRAWGSHGSPASHSSAAR